MIDQREDEVRLTTMAAAAKAPSTKTRIVRPSNTPATGDTSKARAAWLPWLAWGWVALLLLAAVAELTGWDDLRLALDFQRHFR